MKHLFIIHNHHPTQTPLITPPILHTPRISITVQVYYQILESLITVSQTSFLIRIFQKPQRDSIRMTN